MPSRPTRGVRTAMADAVAMREALRVVGRAVAEGRVGHRGERVALLAAETLELARDAVEAIEIEYERTPGVFTLEAALAPGAPHVHEAGNLLAQWRIARGDVARALAGAAV